MFGSRTIAVLFFISVVTITACGGGTKIGDVGTTAAPGGNGGTPAAGGGNPGNADFPAAAASGTGFLEIDGMTFIGDATQSCEIDPSVAVFNAATTDGGTRVEFGGQIFDARTGFISVSFDYDQKYVSNAGDGWGNNLNASVRVEGSTLFWAGTFSVTEDYLDTGEYVQGRLSVTC